MKRLVSILMIIFIVLLFSACGGKTAEQSETAVPVPTTDYSAALNEQDEQDDISNLKIGFSLAGGGAFYDQLVINIEKECSALNYEAQINIADSAEQQEQDLESMLRAGVAVIILDPVNVDLLELILAECETQSVPVINIINSINGLVSTLISPDYLSIGKLAGQSAIDILGEAGGGCMMLKTDYDSFTMQLLSDGFNSSIDGNANVSLISEQFCGNDEEQAYVLTKAELLSEKTISFIFAQSDVLASGALRAIDETDKDVSLVVYGADMDIIESVISGNVHAAIFFGPAELASSAVYFADRFVKDDEYLPPQYKELIVEVAELENAEGYFVSGEAYAEIIGE